MLLAELAEDLIPVLTNTVLQEPGDKSQSDRGLNPVITKSMSKRYFLRSSAVERFKMIVKYNTLQFTNRMRDAMPSCL